MEAALIPDDASMLLSNAVLYIGDGRFVLGAVEVAAEDASIHMRIARPPSASVLDGIFVAWTTSSDTASVESAPAAQRSVPSESVWAQRSVPSESVWAQRSVPSESVWAQHSVPSESVWAQRSVPSESVWAQRSVPSESVWAQRSMPSEFVWAQRSVPSESVWAQRSVPSESVSTQGLNPLETSARPASATEFNAMIAALAFSNPAHARLTPVTIVGWLPDGRRCAVAIDRGVKLTLTRDSLRIDTDASGPTFRVATG